MTQDEILKVYEVAEPPDPDHGGTPCATCAAKEQCDAASDVGGNPYFRVCHDGWNLQLKEQA